MVEEEIEKFCEDFKFYLKTETQMEPTSITRTMVAIKRLLRQNFLIDRKTFLNYAYKRIDKDGIDPYTINKEISAVKHYLKFRKIKWEEIKYFKTTVKNIIAPTQEEIETFVSIHTTDAFDMYWHLQTTCGTRPNEVLSLQIGDINFNDGCFWPKKTKTNDGKPIPIPPRIIPILKNYIKKLPKPVNYIFPSTLDRDKPLTVAAAEKDCRKRLKEMNCDMPWTPKVFRHSWVTIGFKSGLPEQYVQRGVRHKKPQTTHQYHDKSVDYMKEAVANHPLYRGKKSAQDMVDEWVEHINQTLDARFDKATMQQAYAYMYNAIKVNI